MSGAFLAGNNTAAPQSGNAPAVPLQISYNDLTDLPDLNFVLTGDIEQVVTENQNKVVSSAGIAGVTVDLAEGLHAATATGIANAATLTNIHGQSGSTNLNNFNQNLTEDVSVSILQTYNPNNAVSTDFNNPGLEAVSGYDGLAIGESNLDKGIDLATDGTFWHDSKYVINAGSLQSYEVQIGDDVDIIRVRADNGEDEDHWSLGKVGGLIGTTRTIPAASSTVAAHDALVYLDNGATSVHFAETDPDRPQEGNTEAIFNISEAHYGETFTIRVKYFANNEAAGNAYRDDIRIADPAVDQDGFIETGNGAFNLTIPGFEPFVGFFYWKYRASDKSIIVLYTPDHNRSDVSSFTLTLTYPVAAVTTNTPQHLSFVPFTHQPVADDMLIVTLHYVSGTDWQIVATNGNGAVLERGVYDMGAFDEADVVYFRDTTQYQRLSFDATAGADLSIEAVTTLHNNARVKGFGLYNFTDETIFGLTADHFINPKAIDGGVGQNWKTLHIGNVYLYNFAVGTPEHGILRDPNTQMLRISVFNGGVILLLRDDGVLGGSYLFSGSYLGVVATMSVTSSSKSNIVFSPPNLNTTVLQRIEYTTGTSD